MTRRPFPSPAQTLRSSTSATPNWAIVGASRVAAGRMIPAIRRVADGQVRSIHSHNAARAHTFAETQHIPHTFTDLEQMLARFDIDCVYVGSHPRHHAEGVIAALRAGKHVLCESPLALDNEEAQRLVIMASNRGLTLALNHQLRASPAIQTMRRLLREERVGQVITVRVSNAHALPAEQQSWRLRMPGGGVLFDRTIHDVDLMRYLLHDEPREAAGTLGQQLLGNAAEDIDGQMAAAEEVFIHLRMEHGDVNVQIHDSFLLPHTVDVVEVHGTRGVLIAQQWTARSGVSDLLFVRNGQRELAPISPSIPTTSDPYEAVVRAFLNAATNHPDPSAEILATGEDGLNNLAVTLKLADIVRRSRQTRLTPSVKSVIGA